MDILGGDYVDRFIREKCPDELGYTDQSRLQYKRWIFSDDFISACLNYIYWATIDRLEKDGTL